MQLKQVSGEHIFVLFECKQSLSTEHIEVIVYEKNYQKIFIALCLRILFRCALIRVMFVAMWQANLWFSLAKWSLKLTSFTICIFTLSSHHWLSCCADTPHCSRIVVFVSFCLWLLQFSFWAVILTFFCFSKLPHYLAKIFLFGPFCQTF